MLKIYKTYPDCCINLNVLCNVVGQSVVERLLLTAGANSRRTVILPFYEFSLSFQTSVIADLSSWHALSY